jgi:DNA-binding LytR/AlgR family response regulator
MPLYFRCHRAFIVNLDNVLDWKGNALGYQLTIRDYTQKIPVSRQKVKAFDQLYHP